MMYRFNYTLETEADGRWSAWLSSYPACSAWGETKEEALQALADMTVVFLGVMQDSSETVHADSTEHDGNYVEMDAGIVNLDEVILGDTAFVKNEVIGISALV